MKVIYEHSILGKKLSFFSTKYKGIVLHNRDTGNIFNFVCNEMGKWDFKSIWKVEKYRYCKCIEEGGKNYWETLDWDDNLPRVYSIRSNFMKVNVNADKYSVGIEVVGKYIDTFSYMNSEFLGIAHYRNQLLSCVWDNYYKKSLIHVREL